MWRRNEWNRAMWRLSDVRPVHVVLSFLHRKTSFSFADLRIRQIFWVFVVDSYFHFANWALFRDDGSLWTSVALVTYQVSSVGLLPHRPVDCLQCSSQRFYHNQWRVCIRYHTYRPLFADTRFDEICCNQWRVSIQYSMTRIGGNNRVTNSWAKQWRSVMFAKSVSTVTRFHSEHNTCISCRAQRNILSIECNRVIHALVKRHNDAVVCSGAHQFLCSIYLAESNIYSHTSRCM